MAHSKQSCGRLNQNEELIWTGEPFEDKDHCRIDRWLLPLSGLLLAFSTFFAVCLICTIARKGFHAEQLLSTILFLFIGGFSVYAYFLRFEVKRRNKSYLSYGITNRHRLLIRDHKRKTVYQFTAEQLRHARIAEVDKNGFGTIAIEPPRLRYLFLNTGLEFLLPPVKEPVALYDIPDCKKVYRLLRGKR